MSYGYGCVKWLLSFYNFFSFFYGAVLLFTGYLTVEYLIDYTDLQVVRDEIYSSCYVAITAGVVMVLTSLFGCCGSKRQSIFMLRLYIGFLIVIMVFEIVAGSLALKYKDSYEKDVEDALNKSFAIGDDINKWNDMQQQLKCCGVNGPSDYESIPESCLSKNKLYEKGCVNKLQTMVGIFIDLLIGCSFGLAASKIIGTGCALYVSIVLKRKEMELKEKNKHIYKYSV